MSVSDVKDVLSNVFRGAAVQQFNKTLGLGKLINVVRGEGQQVAKTIEHQAGTAKAYAESATITDDGYKNTYSPLYLPVATYGRTFEVSDLEVDLSMSSLAASPSVRTPLESRYLSAIEKIAKKIDVDLMIGDGTDDDSVPNIIGFNEILAQTGTYGGIDRSVKTDFKGYLSANSGTPRDLTVAMMELADTTLFNNVGYDDYDVIVTTPELFQKYSTLWKTNTNVNSADTFLTANIGKTDFAFKGVPVIKVPNMPAGTMLFLNRKHVELQVWRSAVGDAVDSTETETGVSVKVLELGRTGLKRTFWAGVTLQLVCDRPNAFALLKDLQ
jgi:hypothetical protein